MGEMEEDFIMDFRTDGRYITALRFFGRGWVRVGRRVSLSEVEGVIGAFRKIDDLGLTSMEGAYEDGSVVGKELPPGALPILESSESGTVDQGAGESEKAETHKEPEKRPGRKRDPKAEKLIIKLLKEKKKQREILKALKEAGLTGSIKIIKKIAIENNIERRKRGGTPSIDKDKFKEEVTIILDSLKDKGTEPNVGRVSKALGFSYTMPSTAIKGTIIRDMIKARGYVIKMGGRDSIHKIGGDDLEAAVKRIEERGGGVKCRTVYNELGYNGNINTKSTTGKKINEFLEERKRLLKAAAKVSGAEKEGVIVHSNQITHIVEEAGIDVKSDFEIEKVITEMINEKVRINPQNIHLRLGFKDSPNPNTETGKRIYKCYKKYEKLEKSIEKKQIGRPSLDPKIMKRGLYLLDMGWTERKVVDKLKEEFNLEKLSYNMVNKWKKKREEESKNESIKEPKVEEKPHESEQISTKRYNPLFIILGSSEGLPICFFSILFSNFSYFL